MNALYEKFLSYQERIAAFNMAFILLDWDQNTLAPKGASEKTSHLLGVLSEEFYRLATDPEYLSTVEALSKDETLAPDERELIRRTLKDQRQMAALPSELYSRIAVANSRSVRAWEEAKKTNDFAHFAPFLKESISLTKEAASYQNLEKLPIYDFLLDQYEEGFTTEKLDAFFGMLRERIVPLLKRCEAKNGEIRTDFMKKSYPVEKQREFNIELAKYIGFDMDRGVIAEYMHPFTTNLHKDDVRITTDYDEFAFDSAIFSTIHEGGHAMFEQDRVEKYAYVPASGFSMGLHESQSRLNENMMGRSLAFWKPLYPKLQALFPENLSDVSLGEFYRAINRPEASLIRCDADELSYCLHIMIRYEMEKKIFLENAPVEALPKLWNDLYREYLGVEVPDDAHGILQDVHWSQGSFGYFPSYAIGNAIAAQIYHTMGKDFDIDAALESGNANAIHEWLSAHIHKYGGILSVNDLLKQATGEDFNPRYFTDYLEDKYTKLYETAI